LILLGERKVQHSNKVKLIGHLILLLLRAKEIESNGYLIFLDLGLQEN
jgi:hypothetical protein